MQFKYSFVFIAIQYLSIVSIASANDQNDAYLNLMGNAHMQSSPEYELLMEQFQEAMSKSKEEKMNQMKMEDRRQPLRNLKRSKSSKSSKCNPDEDVVLSDFEQWKDETGYWIGEYSFYGPDGKPNVSTSWPYPYQSYKGFITGNVEGNKYRQRNVFLYPPQDTDVCDTLTTTKVVGDGTCGVNGNTKIFEADQAATKCDGGNIEGPFISVVPTYTYTTLIGKDNAVLYQVYMPAGFYPFGFVNITLPEDRIFQSQLTTITKSMDGSQVYRTRTAQGFDAFGFGGTAGVSNYASYYRERKVTKEEFYEEFANAKAAYNIRDEDLCKWDGNNNDALGEGVDGSMAACEAHLEESFELL